MIAIALPYRKQSHWTTLSFASTLYLCPIIDLLLEKIAPEWHPELRLGLQEALVNAAKHGNKLDPQKTVVVHFSITDHQYSWVICDEGDGFSLGDRPPGSLHELPPEEAESGRGLCLLEQIFDHVHWNFQGNQLILAKQIKSLAGESVSPLIS